MITPGFAVYRPDQKGFVTYTGCTSRSQCKFTEDESMITASAPCSPRQGELLELPAHHLPHPLLLRDVPHPGLQLPPQQQLQEQNIFQAAEVFTSTIYLFTAHQWSVPSG